MAPKQSNKEKVAVTGAFGYTGRYIAARLLATGRQTITLTNAIDRENVFEGRILVYPLDFSDIDGLSEALAGVSVLYNTYWVRFAVQTNGHSNAYRNTLNLFEAAKRAGVERIVHLSIANPSLTSQLDYFREKAEVEEELKASGVSYAILRPATIFGNRDILINNIAWALRHLPVFGVFGKGDYRIRPIHVEDLAELAVAQGANSDSVVVDAVGPEIYRYKDLVKQMAKILGKRRLILSVPPPLGYAATVLIGRLVGDIMMKRDEVRALMQGLLSTDSPPSGTTKLSEWMRENAENLGKEYAKPPKRKRS